LNFEFFDLSDILLVSLVKHLVGEGKFTGLFEALGLYEELWDLTMELDALTVSDGISDMLRNPICQEVVENRFA